jgi:hypothetical protein
MTIAPFLDDSQCPPNLRILGFDGDVEGRIRGSYSICLVLQISIDVNQIEIDVPTG